MTSDERNRDYALRLLALVSMNEAVVTALAMELGADRYRFTIDVQGVVDGRDLFGASDGEKFETRFEHAERLAEYWAREMERLRPKAEFTDPQSNV